jgi:hypothetical protein
MTEQPFGNPEQFERDKMTEQEFLDSHWANDMLDAPHALIAVIETKISRALLGERRRIVQVLTENCSDYHTALMGCECSVQIELIS